MNRARKPSKRSRFFAWVLGFEVAAGSVSCLTAPARELLRAPVAREWKPEHEARWREFLLTDAGRALTERMQAAHYDLACRGMQDVMHTAHSAGVTDGFWQAIQWLASLSRSSTRSNEELEPDKANDVQGSGEPLPEFVSP